MRKKAWTELIIIAVIMGTVLITVSVVVILWLRLPAGML